MPAAPVPSAGMLIQQVDPAPKGLVLGSYMLIVPTVRWVSDELSCWTWLVCGK